MHMFRFSYEDVAALLKETGFVDITGEKDGMQLYVQASKPHEERVKP